MADRFGVDAPATIVFSLFYAVFCTGIRKLGDGKMTLFCLYFRIHIPVQRIQWCWPEPRSFSELQWLDWKWGAQIFQLSYEEDCWVHGDTFLASCRYPGIASVECFISYTQDICLDTATLRQSLTGTIQQCLTSGLPGQYSITFFSFQPFCLSWQLPLCGN